MPFPQGAMSGSKVIDTIMVDVLATSLKADLLVLLTDVDGILDGNLASQYVVDRTLSRMSHPS